MVLKKKWVVKLFINTSLFDIKNPSEFALPVLESKKRESIYPSIANLSRIMNRIEVLCKLPAALVGSTVFSFLDILDIVQFNSSCCSYTTQEMLREAMQWTHPMDVLKLKLNTKHAVHWLFNHKLRIGRATIECDHHTVSDLFIQQFILHPDCVQNIELSYSAFDLYKIRRTNESYLTNALFCARVNALVFDGPALTPLMDFGQVHNLTALRCMQSSRVAISTLSTIIQNNKGLNNLILELNEPTIGDDFRDALVSVLPALITLSLGISGLSQDIITLVEETGFALRQLTLGAQFVFSGGRAVKRNIAALGNFCPSLESLTLIGISPSDDSLEHVIRNCRQLRTLNLPETILSDSFYSAMADCEPLVTGLTVGWVWDEDSSTSFALYAGAAFFAHLHSFSVHVRGAGTTLHSLSLAIALMTSLESLHIQHTSSLPESLLLSLGGTSASRRLRELRLEGMNEDAPCDAVHMLLPDCPFLEVLHLGTGAGQCDETLHELGRCCPQLHTLVAQRRLVTDSGVIALAKGCPKLRHLHLLTCKCLTDDSLTALKQHCPELESLQLPECMSLRVAAVAALVRGCGRLRELHLDEAVTTEVMARAIRRAAKRRKLIIALIGLQQSSRLVNHNPLELVVVEDIDITGLG